MSESLRVGLLVAVVEEATTLVKQLKLQALPPEGACKVYGGVCEGAALTLVISGAGPDRARRGARLLSKLCQPHQLISVGLSGGLTEDLGPGSVVLANEVVTPQGGSWKPDLSWLEACELEASLGRLVTVTRVLVKAQDKRDLGRATGAVAVDMESASLAEVAQETGASWAALRAVSDPVNEDLPLDFNLLWDAEGQPDLARITLATLKRPTLVPRLLRFSREVLQARHRLARGLHCMIRAFSR